MMFSRQILCLLMLALIVSGCGDREAGDAKSEPPIAESDSSSETKRATPDTNALREATTREEVLTELASLVSGSEQGVTANEWRSVKETFWSPELDAVVSDERSAGEPPRISEMLQDARGEMPLIAQILRDDFSGSISESEKSFLQAYHSLAMISAQTGGQSLPDAVSDRVESEDITRGDVFVLEIFDDAFTDVKKRPEISDSTLREWGRLAESPNDVIRLLALRNFRRVTQRPEEWVDFYRRYTNEENPEILEEVIDLVFQTSEPEAAQVLSDIRQQSPTGLTDELAEKVDRSIEWFEQRGL